MNPSAPGSSFPPVVAVDLDGTLLHPSPAGIAVPGRTTAQYMSHETARRLASLSRRLPVVIATGRNGASVAGLVRQIPEVRFAGFVLENGMVARRDLDHAVPIPDPWPAIMERLPGWERLPGYEKTLGLLIPPGTDRPIALAAKTLRRAGTTGRLYREGRKLFVYPRPLNKMAGLRALKLTPFVVLGDWLNDLGMIRASRHAGTPESAHLLVRRTVAERGGFVAKASGHDGAVALLVWAERMVTPEIPGPGRAFTPNQDHNEGIRT